VVEAVVLLQILLEQLMEGQEGQGLWLFVI